MKNKALLQKRALQYTKDLLIARRQGNIQRDQAAYNKLAALCAANGFDFAETLADCTRRIRQSSAATMQGW